MNSETAARLATKRWLALGVIQQRISESLITEVGQTSADVAAETGTLSRLFQDLAVRADAQNKRVSSLSQMANKVCVDGEMMEFDELTSMLEDSLAAIVRKILLLSQNAMAMVYAFDEVSNSMTAVENCIGEVNRINSQMRMLAINARIEATRAGEAGRAFTVIADEVRSLSANTRDLAETMRTHISKVVMGLKQSHEALRTVATIDMSENIMAKEKLGSMVGALLDRNGFVRSVADSAATDAGEISQKVSAAITSLQFQDRVSQRLEQVMDTLRIVGDAITRLREESPEMSGANDVELPELTSWLHELASRYRLSAMRAAFVSRVIEGRDEAQAMVAESAEAGSIDLF